MCNVIRKQTRLLERKEKQCEVARQSKSNQKKFWKYVNSKSKLHIKIGYIKSTGSDGQVLVATADDDKANVLGDLWGSAPSQNFKKNSNFPKTFKMVAWK